MPARTVPLRATLEHIGRVRNHRYSEFQIFGDAKVKPRENNTGHLRAAPPGIFFATIDQDRSASVRVTFGFGSGLGQPIIVAAAGSPGQPWPKYVIVFERIKRLVFRDTVGFQPELEVAKR